MQLSASQPEGRDKDGRSPRTGASASVPRSIKLGLAALAAFLVYRFRARTPSGPAAPAPPGSDPHGDPVSPELALIDAELRERIVSAERTAFEDEPIDHTERAAAATGRPRRSRRLLVGLAALLGVAVVIAVAIALATTRRDASPAVVPTIPSHPATTARGSAAAGRDFAWAPVKGVSKYQVELRRGGAIVYSVTTSAAHVKVPARWRRRNRTLTLSPGAYQWYVWPLVGTSSRSRRGPAVVATTVTIR